VVLLVDRERRRVRDLGVLVDRDPLRRTRAKCESEGEVREREREEEDEVEERGEARAREGTVQLAVLRGADKRCEG